VASGMSVWAQRTHEGLFEKIGHSSSPWRWGGCWGSGSSPSTTPRGSVTSPAIRPPAPTATSCGTSTIPGPRPPTTRPARLHRLPPAPRRRRQVPRPRRENGWHHSKAFTLGDFHEPIRIKPKNARILHGITLPSPVPRDIGVEAPSVAGATTDPDAVSCVHCHAGVGHGPTR